MAQDGNHPQMAQQSSSVKYSNLPRYCVCTTSVYLHLLRWSQAAIARARAAAGGRRLRHAVADLRALPEEDPKPRLSGDQWGFHGISTGFNRMLMEFYRMFIEFQWDVNENIMGFHVLM